MKYITIDGAEYALSHCITCGMPYIVVREQWDKQREQGGFHHCPNGHSQGWDKEGSENAKLRRERDRLKQDAARLIDERRAAELSAENERKKAERLRRRVAAGVCPSCHRTVAQLARHMKTKHPNVVKFPKTA